MEIILRPKSGGSKFKFPSLPEKVEVAAGANYRKFDILSLGTVKIPRGRQGRKVSWKHVFFGKPKRKERIVQTKNWKAPKSCIKQLYRWLKKGTELNLIVTGTSINLDVTVSDLDYAPYGAFGNYEYSIVLEEARELRVYTTKEKGIGKSKSKAKKKKKKTKARKKKQKKEPNKKEYTTSQGNTLWGIARKQLGDGSRWREVYEKNYKTLKDKSKLNRDGTIPAGMKLKLP